ncbi:MAG TPA: hypothetical protein DEA08_26805 [Planctomycetes bacterium]|nr:hypothetical protein [Planctomycetota bacterium]
MLNKGPHVVDAIRVLDDILRRMQDHQQKKTAMLRSLEGPRALREQGLSASCGGGAPRRS